MDVIIKVHIPGLAGLLMGLLEKLPHGGQVQLAKSAGVARETISKLANGGSKGVTYERLARIAVAAEWTLNDLSIPVELLEERHINGKSMRLARWLFNAIAVDGEEVSLSAELLSGDGPGTQKQTPQPKGQGKRS